jgi:invasion protein IalB
MHSSLQGVATAAILALFATGATQAQETTPAAPAETAPATAPETAPAPEAAPADATPEAAEPAAAEADDPDGPAATGDPAEPEILEIVRATFGDWQVRCAPNGEDCFMYQLAVDNQQNPVAEVSLLKLPAGQNVVAGATIVTPLGTLLPPGLAIQIDTNEARQYPFAWCSQVGCFSRFGMDNETISMMKRGRAGRMTLLSVGAPDQPVVLELSLTGFTAAFDSLTAPEAPPAAN